MFETLYIHIGTGKTGTSSIQRALWENRALLEAEADLHIPPVRMNQHPLISPYHPRPRDLPVHFNMRHDDAQIAAYSAEFREQLAADAAASGARTACLSSEFFMNISPEGVDFLGDYAARLARAARIVCYIREPVAHAVSAVQQAIKRGKVTLEAAEGRPFDSGFAEKLDLYAARFGRENLILRPFDRARLHKGDAVQDILHVMGVPEPVAARIEAPQANESLSHEAVLLADALAAEVPRLAGGRRNEDRAGNFHQQLKKIRGARYRPSDALVDRIRAGTAADTDRLARDYGLSFPPYIPPEPQPLWGEQSLADIARLINDLARDNADLRARLRRREGGASDTTGRAKHRRRGKG